MVRVERARVDGLVGVFERRLEEQSSTGEIERAMHGAELRMWLSRAPEHMFVWWGERRMEGSGAASLAP